MEPLTISKYPNDILRKNCSLVERITDSEVELFEQMLFTIRHFAGMGLAAPEIGIAKSLIVASIGEDVVKLANPVILDSRGSVCFQEGCLSFPGLNFSIRRPDRVTVKGLNENNEEIEFEAQGFLARVLQHEIDHLNGKLIIDYLRLPGRIKLLKQRFMRFK